MDEARFLLSGDYLDGSLQRVRGARQEFVAIAGVAKSAGAHGADTDDTGGLIFGGHLREHGGGELDSALADASVAEDALADARHLPCGGQNFRGGSRYHFRRQHTDGVAADVDGGVSGHKGYDKAPGAVGRER